MTRRLSRIIGEIVFWWRVRRYREPKPLADLRGQLDAARKSHRPTAGILSRMKRERIDGIKMELGR